MLNNNSIVSRCESNHVEVIKRHVMSVSSEDVHETLRVNVGSMAISGCRLLSLNETVLALSCLKHACFQVMGCLVVDGLVTCLEPSLFHVWVVLVKWVISVLDNEWVLHWDTCWATESLLSWDTAVLLLWRWLAGLNLFQIDLGRFLGRWDIDLQALGCRRAIFLTEARRCAFVVWATLV